MNNIYDNSYDSIKKAAQIINNGGLVSFPTETVYGLGANALNPIAVAGIFRVKKRPFFDPLIVHIDDTDKMNKIVSHLSDTAKKVIDRFWPGPLTVVLPKSDIVPEIVTAGHSTVAVRMPDNPIALSLIKESGVPIAAPSANPFKYLSPTSAKHVFDQIGNDIDMIIDGGHCRIGIESTIIDLTDDHPVLLRHGGLSYEVICEYFGYKIEIATENDKPVAPGQLLHHYSPHTKLILFDNDDEPVFDDNKNYGYLGLDQPKNKDKYSKIEVLSNNKNLDEAAANLFSALHNLDEQNIDIIYAKTIPLKGLGHAIMDRLIKASYENNN